jgi:hypothetical protein
MVSILEKLSSGYTLSSYLGPPMGIKRRFLAIDMHVIENLCMRAHIPTVLPLNTNTFH